MFINKNVQDVIVVILSVCYVDHLLCHDFSGSNSSGFSAKKKKGRKPAERKKRQSKGPPMPKHTKGYD